MRAVLARRLGAIVAAVLPAIVGCSDDEASPSAAPSTSTTVPPVSVGTITATIAPEAVRFGEEAGIDLPSEVRGILERVDELLQLYSEVAVTVTVDADRVIPEVGVGGFTDPDSGEVQIWLDPDHPSETEQLLPDWLAQVLAHELNHTKRILEGPGYGATVGEAIVTEGIADAFSSHAFPSAPPPPWANALQPEDISRLSTLAQSSSGTTNTADLHDEWFFGAGDLPRWAGYTVGATWVRDYLATHENVDVVAATLLPAEDIIPG